MNFFLKKRFFSIYTYKKIFHDLTVTSEGGACHGVLHQNSLLFYSKRKVTPPLHFFQFTFGIIGELGSGEIERIDEHKGKSTSETTR